MPVQAEDTVGSRTVTPSFELYTHNTGLQNPNTAGQHTSCDLRNG